MRWLQLFYVRLFPSALRTPGSSRPSVRLAPALREALAAGGRVRLARSHRPPARFCGMLGHPQPLFLHFTL